MSGVTGELPKREAEAALMSEPDLELALRNAVRVLQEAAAASRWRADRYPGQADSALCQADRYERDADVLVQLARNASAR